MAIIIWVQGFYINMNQYIAMKYIHMRHYIYIYILIGYNDYYYISLYNNMHPDEYTANNTNYNDNNNDNETNSMTIMNMFIISIDIQ